MNTLFTVKPAAGVTKLGVGRVSVEVNYLRSTTDDDGTSDNVPASARMELDEQFNGSILLEGTATDQLEANVLSVDGSSLLRKVLKVAEGKALLTLTKEEVSLIADGQQVVPTDTTPLMVVRTAQLVATGSVKVDYARSNVVVVAIADAAALTASGVDTLLKSTGKRISSLEVTGQNLSTLNTLAWGPSHLAVDGTFTASFTKLPTIGWLWWLNGDHQVLGFVPDDLSLADNRILVIALPALSTPAGTQTPTPKKDAGCGRSVPTNVTEAEVANNPEIYTEDPGAFCRPFSNPERVLSEKSFEVIARVTQPEIGPLGSVKGKVMTILNLEGNTNRTTGLSSLPPGALALAMTPTRHNLVSSYADLLKRLPSGRTNMDANHPLQWEDDIAQYQAATVAIGHILEFRVRWRSNGYSLGNVAKTLTLAPRQTKRIQKISWERNESARRSERTQLRDQENDSIVRERDYKDSVAASLSEWAKGGSDSDTEAIAGGIGFFVPPVIGGIGGGAGSAHSTSHQEGGRDTTASEEQRLRDAIRRHGDALRKFESTVVTEVTQEETVTGTTEVIRNANYAHSLTVIYYQILRHLKVTTEFAGVRECVFVPFSIKPFDLHRAYRWREALQAFIRSPLYSRALRYLKDVATNFTTSDIAPGPRAGQQLTFVRGSIYVSLAIERPADTAEGLFDPGRWQVAQPFLETPALGIFSILVGQGVAQRDRTFQAEYAPGIAAKWANTILLRTSGGRVLQADCTLASRYQFNHGVRIDFAISASELAGLSRQALQQITVVPQHGLPPGSVANLTRLSIVYNTDRFEHSVEGRTGTNDLITPDGNRGSAAVALPLDNWEQVDEQLEIRRSVDQLIEHLNEHVEYYSKAVWWRMDRDRLMMLLDGFYVPNTNNVSIASVVDREPVGIIGNSLVYRVGAASFLGYGKVTTPAELYNVYARKGPVSDPMLVSLPTDGLYAQAIMDECAALEEHYGNTDWVLNDPDPELGVIDPSLLLSRRADQTTAVTPTTFPGTIINLQNAPEAPAPSGLQGVLNAVTNPNSFRDMAGLAATQANALGALNTAANLATNFGNQAAALELAKLAKADQATRTADQKIASIKGAVDKGLSTPADAAKATKDVLSAMNPDAPKAQAPHENTAINSAIETAGNIPGSTIEASTGEGSVKVKMGGDAAAEDSGRTFIIPAQDTNTAQNRAFNPQVADKSGRISLRVRISNMPSDSSVRWSVPPREAGRYTLAGGSNVQTGLRADITGLQPGPTAIDVDVLDASGAVGESEKYLLNIPQFIAVDVDPATFIPLMRVYHLLDIEIEQVLRTAKSVVDSVLGAANVRTVWQMAPFNERLPAQFAAGGAAAANVTKAVLRGDPPTPALYGITKDRTGDSSETALIGPTFFDETVDVFAGAFDDAVAGNANENVDEVTNDVVRAIVGAGMTSSQEKSKGFEVLGRLYGETLAHEIGHALIGNSLGDKFHNSAPGVQNDLMNHGINRSFDNRTGFVIDPTQIGSVDLLVLLASDGGIALINRPTTDAKSRIDTFFPVPPVFK